MNKIRLVIGDWSLDGHNFIAERAVECSVSAEELAASFEKNSKMIGFNLTKEVAVEHEDGTIKKEHIDKLKEYNIDVLNIVLEENEHLKEALQKEIDNIPNTGHLQIEVNTFAAIYMEIATLNTEITWKKIKMCELTIGGYGLFS
jgi:hypothetical protein